MKMRAISRAQDKKLVVNNNLGRALKFYASVRIEVRKVEAIKSSGEATGNRTKAKIVKNKVAPPLKEAQFDIMFGVGIDRFGELVDMAADKDIIQKSGAWYSYNGSKIGQGRENTKAYLKEHPEIADEVYEKLFPPKEKKETDEMSE